MRLIDADALGVGRCNPDVILDPAYAAGWNGLLNIITAAPTIDAIKAAGGCYCRECCFGRKPNSAVMQEGYVYCQEQSKYMSADDFCSGAGLREAQDDG